MTLAQQLATLRSNLQQLVSKASTLPKIILQSKGLDVKISLLKAQEKELLKQMSDKELYGSQKDAEADYEQTAEEEAAKTKKTLLIAGSLLGGLVLLGTIIFIVKKIKNKNIKK